MNDVFDVELGPDEVIPLLDGYLRQCICIIQDTEAGKYKTALEHAKAQANTEFKSRVWFADRIVQDSFYSDDECYGSLPYDWEAMVNQLYDDYSDDLVMESLSELSKLRNSTEWEFA